MTLQPSCCANSWKYAVLRTALVKRSTSYNKRTTLDVLVDLSSFYAVYIHLRNTYVYFRLKFIELWQVVVFLVFHSRESSYCETRVDLNLTSYSSYEKELQLTNTIIRRLNNPSIGVLCVYDLFYLITNTKNMVFVDRKAKNIVYSDKQCFCVQWCGIFSFQRSYGSLKD